MIQFLFMSNQQTHPLHSTDRNIIDSLITKEKPEDIDFINLARLINRYTNFPGESEIKNDIEEIPCSNGNRVLAVLASFIAEFR